MPPQQKSSDSFAALPDPSRAASLDCIAGQLRHLKVWAGDPSYETIKDRVNAAWAAAGRPAGELTRKSTVADCFRAGRRRLNTDLVIAVVEALHPDAGYVEQWRQALREVGGAMQAVSQVRVQDKLPEDLAGFTGRSGELSALRRAGDAVVISAIEGMAGVGKTQLAVHAGHLLSRDEPFEQVLFVNLRGFHPDPSQPPVDPAAVLDGFLRMLGVPGEQIPYGLDARARLYRDRIAGTRALVVLDNAATVRQVRPLLPAAPGCVTLITSRRRLTDLPATHLTLDVFTPDEAESFLAAAAPDVPLGTDPGAVARIARRCAYLPLALSLVAGHIRTRPGWTLTDHADRLDERHRIRHLDTGVELALDLSYRHLADDRRRLVKLAALHPGEDFDTYAAAALGDLDLDTARAHLDHLCADHLLRPAGPDRYTFHDLIRAYAITRGQDEDRPPERRAALTRLFDHYLATAATAVNTLFPAEANRRPVVPPAGTPAPELADPDAALAWLDTERLTLVAVAAHSAGHGWPAHATTLARTLFRYLTGGHHTDAATVHGHAHHAALLIGDLAGQAHARTGLGVADMRLGRTGSATEHFGHALDLFRRAGDPAAEARVLHNLGIIAEREGDLGAAADHYRHALVLHRQVGERTGQARTLTNLGDIDGRSGRYPTATGYFTEALALAREDGDQDAEAFVLNGLGEVEARSGRYEGAGEHLGQALRLYRQIGGRTGEGSVLLGLALLQTRLGAPDRAAEHYQLAVTVFRETGDQDGEAGARNGLGESAHATGRPDDALAHHAAAHAIASGIGDSEQQARAHAGLGRAHHSAGDLTRARDHYAEALTLYTGLGLPEADEIRDRLAELEAGLEMLEPGLVSISRWRPDPAGEDAKPVDGYGAVARKP